MATVRDARSRGPRHYDKPALTNTELVARLAERGLSIPDETRAERYVRHIGYYRLSPYTIPFQANRREHLFRPGTAFDDVLYLYVFDRALRLLVMDALERVEVAVRAALTDHMSTEHGGPHWYLEESHFKDRYKHRRLLKIVRDKTTEQLQGNPEIDEDDLVHRSALEHYVTTYGSPDLPPSWLMVETLTLGQLDSAVRNLNRRADKTAIAATLGVNAPLLESWLRTYVRVRNICAHHGRLWNVGLGVYPAIPASRSVSWPRAGDPLSDRSRRRLYPVLASLQSVLEVISPRSTWARRLFDLLARYPDVPLPGMGIPADWEQDPFWARHLL